MSKILQIIPAPVGAYVEHTDGTNYPVACLALVAKGLQQRIVPVAVLSSSFGDCSLLGFDEKGALHIGSNFGELPL